MKPGTKVLVNSGGTGKDADWQEGVVVDARYDDCAHRIAPTHTAVQVCNGQGTWGFPPKRIKEAD